MILTYLDSCVLINAVNGRGVIRGRARQVLLDPHRVFASSIFVLNETLPFAIYYRKFSEVAVYDGFFKRVAYWARDLERVTCKAFEEICDFGVSAADALHIGVAFVLGVDELVTAERPTSKFLTSTTVPIITIY